MSKEWLLSLEEGDKVDVLGINDNASYIASILKIESDDDTGYGFYVHFVGWDQNYDHWISLKYTTDDTCKWNQKEVIKPLHSHTPYHRDSIMLDTGIANCHQFQPATYSSKCEYCKKLFCGCCLVSVCWSSISLEQYKVYCHQCFPLFILRRYSGFVRLIYKSVFGKDTFDQNLSQLIATFIGPGDVFQCQKAFCKNTTTAVFVNFGPKIMGAKEICLDELREYFVTCFHHFKLWKIHQ